MRILFVFEDFDVGGVEKIYINLSNFFFQNHKDIDVYLVAERKKGMLLSKVLSTDKVLEFNKSYKNFSEIIDSFKPEILLLTKGNLMKYALYSKIFCKYKDFKIIITLHNPLNIGFFSWFTRLKRILGAIFFYRLSSAIVTISETMKEEVLRYTKISKDKVKVIYNPIINNEIKLLSEESVDIDYQYLIAVGRLHYQKGYEYMIEIFEEFLRKYGDEFKNLKLLILGDGPEHALLTRIIEKRGLNNKVILLGSVLNPYKYIKNAKAILLTSRFEGFPTVLIEALFLGLPFIAFDCKYGPKEICNMFNCSYIVPFGDKTLFVEKLYNLLKKQERIDIKNKINNFFLENSADSYKQMFEDMVKKND